MNKAFVFSLEAIFCLLLLITLLLITVPEEKKELRTLLVFQKENDLLKIWAKQETLSLKDMKKDFEFAFPQKNGKIMLGNESIAIGKKGSESISSEIAVIGNKLEATKISVSVFG